MRPDRARLSPALVLGCLAALALVSIVLFMTLGARGNWGFVLAFRGTKVATMVLVGYAVAVSTVLFQTITTNRILTPAIMGFDFLYVLIQTVLVYGLGSATVAAIDPRLIFLLQVVLMAVFGAMLYRWLFQGGTRGLHLLLLSGVIFGTLFRSVANLLRRVMDPGELVVLQDRLFASFNRTEPELLLLSAVLIVGVSIVAWRHAATFDVMALGREAAINLGVDHARVVTTTLALVTVLVSISSALVGPVTFFGLLVSNLAYMLVASHRHALILPAAVLLSVVCLVAGQLVLERVLAFDSALSLVIEFVGGITFILMLLRGAAR